MWHLTHQSCPPGVPCASDWLQLITLCGEVVHKEGCDLMVAARHRCHNRLHDNSCSALEQSAKPTTKAVAAHWPLTCERGSSKPFERAELLHFLKKKKKTLYVWTLNID